MAMETSRYPPLEPGFAAVEPVRTILKYLGSNPTEPPLTVDVLRAENIF